MSLKLSVIVALPKPSSRKEDLRLLLFSIPLDLVLLFLNFCALIFNSVMRSSNIALTSSII